MSLSLFHITLPCIRVCEPVLFKSPHEERERERDPGTLAPKKAQSVNLMGCFRKELPSLPIPLVESPLQPRHRLRPRSPATLWNRTAVKKPRSLTVRWSPLKGRTGSPLRAFLNAFFNLLINARFSWRPSPRSPVRSGTVATRCTGPDRFGESSPNGGPGSEEGNGRE